MASTSSPILQILRPRCRFGINIRAAASKLPPAAVSTGVPGSNRRQTLLFLTATTAAIVGREKASMAEDIPLFGLRKKMKKVEEQAEEIVREGFEAAEKGIETAERGIVTAKQGIKAAEREIEKGIVTAERGIVTAERKIEKAEEEIETALNFGALSQAGAVAGAEVVGVLVATSIVNGILGPEGQS